MRSKALLTFHSLCLLFSSLAQLTLGGAVMCSPLCPSQQKPFQIVVNARPDLGLRVMRCLSLVSIALTDLHSLAGSPGHC